MVVEVIVVVVVVVVGIIVTHSEISHSGYSAEVCMLCCCADLKDTLPLREYTSAAPGWGRGPARAERRSTVALYVRAWTEHYCYYYYYYYHYDYY